MLVNVGGQTQTAYADFRPNMAKHHLEELSKISQEQLAELPLPCGELVEKGIAMWERFSQLPPLLIEGGRYCRLLRTARDVFVDGHYYACVTMSGISFERFQRDKAELHGAKKTGTMSEVRRILQKNMVLKVETLALCKKMAKLRNVYAHGDGLNPRKDAFKSLEWMHSFIDNETDLMRDYVVVDGTLIRKRAAGGN